MRRFIYILKNSFLIIFFFTCFNILNAAGSKIEGTVKDKLTNEPLYGANVILIGTSFGSASDIDGNYRIKNIAPSAYTIKVSYIGYESQEISIEVGDGVNLKLDFTLTPVGIEGETIVVTAQAEGQRAAINQQLTSDNIINVVSAARIQELPDANAAESVGRLPGVSLLRSGGEGDRVVVRGLEPKFNAITINGVKLSSSGANNRGADLSMISSNMLSGIQVSKTITPDMDANVIGGVVNFELREAEEKQPGIPSYSFVTRVRLTGLKTQRINSIIIKLLEQ